MHKRNKFILSICVLLSLCGCANADAAVFEDTDSEAVLQTEHIAVEEQAESSQPDASGKTQEVQSSEQEAAEEKVAVFVCGMVNCPGVYYLQEGALRNDAVLAAGGFAQEADTTYVNLAQTVTEGERIYVPKIGEVDASLESQTDTEQSAKEMGNRKIDLNTATREELLSLPGIGQSKADAIIEYRQTHGEFRSVEDIMLIDGIKEGVYKKIKDMITVN